jgi:hypothetical protein
VKLTDLSNYMLYLNGRVMHCMRMLAMQRNNWMARVMVQHNVAFQLLWTPVVTNINLACEISGSHGGEYEVLESSGM